MSTRALRNFAILSFFVALVALVIGGYYGKDRIAPIPRRVVAADGTVLTTGETILQGQTVWQRYGLMDHGSIWGHGSLRGPDFSATTLHMMGEAMRKHYGGQVMPLVVAAGRPVDPDLIVGQQVIVEIKTNRYNAQTGDLPLTPGQTTALTQARAYWSDQFENGSDQYGFLPNTVPTPEERRAIADFFFWTAWAAGTNRPDKPYTYTNNWPPDRSVGNVPTMNAYIWSLASILTLLVVLGIVVYIVHRYEFFYGPARAVETAYELLRTPLTPSQRASAKFFLVAGLLFVMQILNGGLLAHYTIHPAQFYIERIGKFYAYSWAKSWHLQLGIFWLAIAWIGTAIFVAPLVSQHEPKHQRLLVNILFVAALLVVVGSLLGEVLGIKGLLGKYWFWLGHQGWEYLELGRLWQILLYCGMIFWLVIVYRAILPLIKPSSTINRDRKALIIFYVISAILLVAFFGFGLLYGRGTHFTVADYWRWFVVHIWVESIFEFFGVAVISLFLVSLGLVTAQSALRVAYLTAILVFFSGILGTTHHYYWNGSPSFFLSMGAVFSSVEPVPLILLVVRAWIEYKEISAEGREFPYRWPLFFLIASSFWNFLGAAVFGFMINLPIINYYEHATYLTSNHGHTALFGVYGMLAIALLLFSWRGLVRNEHWNDRILRLSFWGLNGGLFLMFLTGLLPIGLSQVWHSFTEGIWYARSAAFYNLPFVQTVGFWRIVPDTIVIVLGALPLLYFLVTTFPRLREVGVAQEPPKAPRP